MKNIFWSLVCLGFLALSHPVFGEESEKLLKEATSLFQAKKYEEALSIYKRILRKGVFSPKIYNNIGAIYTKLYENSGKEEYIKKAIAFFTLASSLDGNYETASKNLNNVLNGYLNEKLEILKKKILEELPLAQEKKQSQKERSSYQHIETKEILNFLHKWKSLWERKDSRYFTLYSKNGCMDFERFVRYKKRIWEKSKNIRIKLEDIHIRRNPDDTVCVTFRQLYSSSIMKSKARKALCLRKKRGKIEIYCEWFIPTVRIE
jgi:tetratricopeptide (TPR) repeat protein